MASLYEILGVRPNATQDEIRKAFRRKSSHYHPDRNKSSDANEKMAEINRAYEILSDPEKRDRYDKEGETKKSLSREEYAHLIIRQIVTEALRQVLGNEDADFLNHVILIVEQNIERVEGDLDTNAAARKHLKKLEKAAKKKNADHPLLSMYDVAKRDLHNKRLAMLTAYRGLTKARRLLDKEYHFDFEVPETPVQEDGSASFWKNGFITFKLF